MKFNVLKKQICYFMYCLAFILMFFVLAWFAYAVKYFEPLSFKRQWENFFYPPYRYIHHSFDRKYSYQKFSKEKQDGYVRIGIFGDSTSAGTELYDESSWVSLLNEWYAEEKLDVEVLNFSLPGYGLHDSFNLWQTEGKKYDLDYVVIGPTCADWNKRDMTFNAIVNYFRVNQKNDYKSLVALSPRYRLDKENNLFIVEPLGKNNLSRFLLYWTPFTHSQYYKYDYFFPIIFRAPLSFISGTNAVIGNPFYYRSDLNEDLSIIKHNIYREIIKSESELVIMNYHIDKFNKPILEEFPDFEHKSDYMIDIEMKSRFYEICVGWHDSPLVHWKKAAYLYNILKLSPNKKTIYDLDLNFYISEQDKSTKKRSSAFDSLELVMESSYKLAELVDYEKYSGGGELCLPPDCHGVNKSLEGIKTVILQIDENTEYDLFAFSLPFKLNSDGLSVEIFKSGEMLQSVGLDIMATDLDSLFFVDKLNLYFSHEYQQIILAEETALAKEMRKVQADEFLLKGNNQYLIRAKIDNNKIGIQALEAKIMLFRASKNSILNLSSGLKDQDVFLEVKNNNKTVYKKKIAEAKVRILP